MIKSLFKNILVVINSSEASIHAAQYGIILSKIYHCNMKVVYVADTATLKKLMLSKFFIQEESSDYEESLVSDGLRYLKHIEELGKSKGIMIETELRKGSIWMEVTAAADDLNADLILLGGYEKSDISQRDAISSSYRDIVVNANCSVLIVKEKMIEQLYKLI